MTPEQLARQRIDKQLTECGWIIHNADDMNISAGLGVAIREFPLKTGFADYMLYADGKAIGVIEAKPEGHTLFHPQARPPRPERPTGQRAIGADQAEQETIGKQSQTQKAGPTKTSGKKRKVS